MNVRPWTRLLSTTKSIARATSSLFKAYYDPLLKYGKTNMTIRRSSVRLFTQNIQAVMLS
jgi:hypothetical protein